MMPPLQPDDFLTQTHEVLDFIADYYRNIENYPVLGQVKPGYLRESIPDSAPYSSETIEAILQDISNDIIPGLTHWQSPNFFAYYQANASTPGFLGEMLCTGFNVVGFSWIASPAATELESIVMDWMGKMLKLPSAFLFSGNEDGGGVMHGSTCEAAVCTMAVARDRVLKKIGWDNISKLVVYASDQTHSTFRKVSRIIGIKPSNFRQLPTSAATGFALSPGVVHMAMKDDVALGLVPMYLCATVGTTGCGAVDPIEGLGLVANEYGVWLHVDAAYAGSACICPEFRHYLDGVELADSFSLNPHKWLLTNMDCCCLWVKSPSSLQDSLSCNAEYLSNNASETKAVIDYKDWQVALSRRFRAMKLWVVIRRFGVAGLREHLRSGIMMAEHFEGLVGADPRFEVVVPRRFSLVCFRLKPKVEGADGNELNKKLLEAINSTGRAFLVHTLIGGKYVLRFAIGGTLTELGHINATWKLIQEKAHLVEASRSAQGNGSDNLVRGD
ncbi:hypothetical protein MRB53_008386 [Persea americana]|uniref:Uncharacterized protein n=1 Tax=Persea americana TaxID=3435 RepID=A0ACC2MMA7_PERAE|nr:hypothetical protein MRB53_008386 [Persea americana]